MNDVKKSIIFNTPSVVGRELEYIRESVERMHTSGGGPFTGRCRELLREALAAQEILFTPSCTDALEMCALLLRIAPGDEVIVPSFSFVSTASAFALRGCRPIFADVRPDTFNLDETRLESLITPRTKAIVVVHYAGVGCEMDAILEIAERHGLAVVEDNAHGLFGTYRGRPLGTLGCLATLSFHETKNFTCGEGGALVINDGRFAERAEIIRDKGTDRQKLFRGEVDKYTWVDLGSSFVLSDILAAFLYAQLERRGPIMAKRRSLWEIYDAALRPWVGGHGVQLPTVPEHCEQAYHMYYMVLPSEESRGSLIEHLRHESINSVFHYTPLHTSRMGQSFGGRPGQCPVTERASDRLLRLPFHHQITEDEQGRVVAEIRRFFEGPVQPLPRRT